MSELDNWLTPPLWTGELKSVLLSTTSRCISDLKLMDVIEKSSDFPQTFPVTSVCCFQLKRNKSEEILEKNINSAYPVIHEKTLFLYAIFLQYQTKFGNVGFYKDISLLDLVDRLLSRRAVAFVGRSDHYLLMDDHAGYGNWESVGTTAEKPPLTLDTCLSYDEIKLSALLSVSSHTCFINDGNRYNNGEVENNLDKIQQTGVIIGLIGTRLEKEKVMEYKEIMKTRQQNVHKYGYGAETLQGKFLDFYGDDNATYDELLDTMKSSPERYIYFSEGDFFDKLMFERRISLSIDTLLIEANSRAKTEGTKAFVHVVGIGLGVWKICPQQDELFMNTFAHRLNYLKNELENISDVCFAYIRHNGPFRDGDNVAGITIHIKNRNPHERLTGVHDGKLLVVSYAWDGNALPGNEFWFGSLHGSGDPAAACSTQVAELHNYHINGKVRGANVRIATLKNGLVTFQQYQDLHRND